jgi:hypothetical protein
MKGSQKKNFEARPRTKTRSASRAGEREFGELLMIRL